ncbi:hypothetical protein O181_084201 [Austropuccinia psidii MF-1]|uniref:Uncharacterized protein n=1 Tax=Austropuccinia psidii MF-1 TaxID=1389203 RepID=A0A9Q3FQI5_9BASI|nr:hypothetical protein [Austropuccinia psidii MF-1]
MGSPSQGSLNATEWALLYKVYIPFLMLSQQITLDEHNSPNTKSKMGQSGDLEDQVTKNTFHWIGAINIATSWMVSMDDAATFAEHWKIFRLSNQHLLQNRKLNQIILLLIIFQNSSNVGSRHKPQPHGGMSA